MAKIDLSGDEIVSVGEETDNQEDNVSGEDFSTLQGLVKARFIKSEDARLFDESRWLRSYRNYRGIYGSDMSFTEKEKSRVFVKITKTKVLAAFGQLIEVLFSSGSFPIGVEPTPIPDGIAEYARVKEDGEPEDEPKEDAGNIIDLLLSSGIIFLYFGNTNSPPLNDFGSLYNHVHIVILAKSQ